MEVRTTSGLIRGATQDGVARFLGVPFADAPFGELRLRPPAPVRPWDGVREATSYGATVPKDDYPPHFKRLFPEPVIAGGDCLNLNVWTPEKDVGTGSLPVMVWIHGGAFVNGSGACSIYDGSAFARDGVVCVTVNYRLGAEGFLFTDADQGTGTANVGLQDQVAALRWVRDNAAAFGGDPTHVTVAGESAGAMSVSTLLAMPSADGLFAQAILESGAAAHTLPAETGVAVAETLAERLGTDATRESIAMIDADVVGRMSSELSNGVQDNPDPEKWGELALRILLFAPTIDGTVLPEHPLNAIAKGASSGVRLLFGSNRQEGRLFFVATRSTRPPLPLAPPHTACHPRASTSTGVTTRVPRPGTSWPRSLPTGTSSFPRFGSPRPVRRQARQRGRTASIGPSRRTTTASAPRTRWRYLSSSTRSRIPRSRTWRAWRRPSPSPTRPTRSGYGFSHTAIRAGRRTRAERAPRESSPRRSRRWTTPTATNARPGTESCDGVL